MAAIAGEIVVGREEFKTICDSASINRAKRLVYDDIEELVAASDNRALSSARDDMLLAKNRKYFLDASKCIEVAVVYGGSGCSTMTMVSDKDYNSAYDNECCLPILHKKGVTLPNGVAKSIEVGRDWESTGLEEQSILSKAIERSYSRVTLTIRDDNNIKRDGANNSYLLADDDKSEVTLNYDANFSMRRKLIFTRTRPILWANLWLPIGLPICLLIDSVKDSQGPQTEQTIVTIKRRAVVLDTKDSLLWDNMYDILEEVKKKFEIEFDNMLVEHKGILAYSLGSINIRGKRVYLPIIKQRTDYDRLLDEERVRQVANNKAQQISGGIQVLPAGKSGSAAEVLGVMNGTLDLMSNFML